MLRDFKSSALVLYVIIYNQASGFQNGFMTQSEMYCQSLLTGNCLHILASGCRTLSFYLLHFRTWRARYMPSCFGCTGLIIIIFKLLNWYSNFCSSLFFSPCSSSSTFMTTYIFTSSDLLIYSFTFVLCAAKTHSKIHQFLKKWIICRNSDPH